MSENGVSASLRRVSVLDAVISRAAEAARGVKRESVCWGKRKSHGTTEPQPDPAVSSSMTARRISIFGDNSDDEGDVASAARGETPTVNDVLCMRGPEAFHHVGNRRFRVRVELNVNAYFERELAEKNGLQQPADRSHDHDADWRDHKRKGRIVDEVIHTIAHCSPPGRFLVKVDDDSPQAAGTFLVADPHTARLKVEQTFSAAGRYLGLIQTANPNATAPARDPANPKLAGTKRPRAQTSDQPQPQPQPANITKEPPQLPTNELSAQIDIAAAVKKPQRPQKKRKSVQFKPQPDSIVKIPKSEPESVIASGSNNSKQFTTSNSPTPVISDKDFYKLNHNDVICETDPDYFHSIGNRRFRVLVEAGLQTYCSAADSGKTQEQTAKIQSRVVQEVIAAVLSSCHPCPGRFLQLKRPEKDKKSSQVADNCSTEETSKENWPWRVMTSQEAQEKTETIFQVYANIMNVLKFQQDDCSKNKKDKKPGKRKQSSNSSSCLWMTHDGWGTSITYEEPKNNVPVERRIPKRNELLENAATTIKDHQYSDDDDTASVDEAFADKNDNDDKGIDNGHKHTKHHDRDPKTKQVVNSFGDASVAIAAAKDAKVRAKAVREKKLNKFALFHQQMSLKKPLAKSAEHNVMENTAAANFTAGPNVTKKRAQVGHALQTHSAALEEGIDTMPSDRVSSSQRTNHVSDEEPRSSKRVSLNMGEIVRRSMEREERVTDDVVDLSIDPQKRAMPQQCLSSEVAANLPTNGNQLENISKEALSQLQLQAQARAQAHTFLQKLLSTETTSSSLAPEFSSSDSRGSNDKENSKESLLHLQERAKMLLLTRQWNNTAGHRLLPSQEATPKSIRFGVYGANGQQDEEAQNTADMSSVGLPERPKRKPEKEKAGSSTKVKYSTSNIQKGGISNLPVAKKKSLESISALQDQAISLLKNRQYEVAAGDLSFDRNLHKRVPKRASVSSRTKESDVTSSMQASGCDRSLRGEQRPPPVSFDSAQTSPLPISLPARTLAPPQKQRGSITISLSQEEKLTKKAALRQTLQSIEGQYDDAENDITIPSADQPPSHLHDELKPYTCSVPAARPLRSLTLSEGGTCHSRRLSGLSVSSTASEEDAIGGILMMTTRRNSSTKSNVTDGAALDPSDFYNSSRSFSPSMPGRKGVSICRDSEEAAIEAMLAVRRRGSA